MRHCLDQLCKSLRLYVIPLRQGQPRSHFASVKSEEMKRAFVTQNASNRRHAIHGMIVSVSIRYSEFCLVMQFSFFFLEILSIYDKEKICIDTIS